jgi:hypothetical protein
VRRRWRSALLAVLLLLGAAAGAAWWRIRPLALVGAGYVAKQMCSCIFVGGRSFESCRPDMLPAMDDVHAE